MSTDNITTRDTFCGQFRPQPDKVNILGREILFRPWMGTQRDIWVRAALGQRENAESDVVQLSALKPLAVALTVCDETGALLFSADNLSFIQDRLPYPVIDAIFTEALRRYQGSIVNEKKD